MTVVNVLSGGAAAAVVKGVQAQFERETGSRINGTFSAVGEMRDKLVAGAPCDVVILTKPLIAQLIASGHVVEGSAKSLGLVKTGVAVKAGSRHPPIGQPRRARRRLPRRQGDLPSRPREGHRRHPLHERAEGAGPGPGAEGARCAPTPTAPPRWARWPSRTSPT